jgi:glycogen synthase
MGTGSDEFANQLRNAAGRYHGKVVAHIGFTPELEHKIIAGDLLAFVRAFAVEQDR